ncbi:MAG: hypothetical protein AAGA29_07725 [Planctomycetota bacterium]
MSIATRSLFPAAALLVSLAMPALAQAEEGYDLVFDRPHEAGARYTVSGEAHISEEMQQRVNGQATESQSTASEINLEGVVEVLAVNETGGVTQLAMTVGEYDIEINDQGVELQQDRRIIGAVEGDEAQYRYENGDAIEGELAELLDIFLDDLLDDEGEAEDPDRIMNIDGPKSPGDRWAMDHAYMVQSAVEVGQLSLDADKMESEVHFVELNEDNDFGTAMAVIAMSMRAEDFSFPSDDFPEWLAIKESYIEMEGGGMLAIDPEMHRSRHDVEMEMAFLASGEVPGQGAQVEVEFEAHRRSSVTLSEMP